MSKCVGGHGGYTEADFWEQVKWNNLKNMNKLEDEPKVIQGKILESLVTGNPKDTEEIEGMVIFSGKRHCKNCGGDILGGEDSKGCSNCGE